MITPGLVTDTTGDAATEEESTRRLEWQKQNGYILPFEEFAHRVIDAIDLYARRTHGTLKHSPLEELKYAVEAEGWRQTKIEEDDIKYLFLERAFATVRDGRVTLAGRQFIGPDLTPEMIRANRGNLAGLNRQKVELRYDPDDLDAGAWAIDPRNSQAISLTPVIPVAMLDDKAASAALEWKRRNMKAVGETYRSMTSDAQTLFDPHKFKELTESRAVAAIAAPEPELSDDDFSALVAAKITVEPNIRARQKIVFLTERDRYESLRVAHSSGQKVSAADLAFMAEYESKMTDGEITYFASQARLNKTQGVIA
jgi:putative transposase